MAGRITSRRLIGRGAELAVLRSLLDAARGGSARIALVSGDAGIGKTRLVMAALDEAGADGFVVAYGGCVELGAVSVAFAPFAEALRRLQCHERAPRARRDQSGGGCGDSRPRRPRLTTSRGHRSRA